MENKFKLTPKDFKSNVETPDNTLITVEEACNIANAYFEAMIQSAPTVYGTRTYGTNEWRWTNFGNVRGYTDRYVAKLMLIHNMDDDEAASEAEDVYRNWVETYGDY